MLNLLLLTNKLMDTPKIACYSITTLTICYLICQFFMPYRTNILSNALWHFYMSFQSNVLHTIMNKYTQLIKPKNINTKLNNKNVIMYVHGRNGCYTDFKPFINIIKKHYRILPQNELIKNGYDANDVVIKLGNKYYVLRSADLGNTDYSSIDEDGMRLSNELMPYTNCNIIFLALSKGGLVAMRYVTKIHSAKNTNIIKMLITISSPLKGTEITMLFSRLSPVRLALGWNSQISREIDSDRKKLKDIRICHVVPKYDCLVIPTSSAMYDDVEEQYIYHHKDKKYGHGGMMYCEKVAMKIVNWIISYMDEKKLSD